MTKKKTESEKMHINLINRREHFLGLLESKYLFNRNIYAKRTSFIEPDEFPHSAHMCGAILQTISGASFLLAMVINDSQIEIGVKEAFNFAFKSETIGIVAILPLYQNKVFAYRRRFYQDKFEEVPELEYYCKGLIGSQGSLFEDADANRKVLLPISNKLENLFFEIHSCMRDIDGLHADEALEELSKLLYVKVYDEELCQRESDNSLHTVRFGSREEYAASIRQRYREANEYDLRVFRLKIPEYERSRGVFTQPIKLSSAALVRSYQMIENYSLTKSRSDVKGRAFQKVLGRAVRAGMGQYFTPANLCEFMVEICQPKVSELILDPFCGSGHFLSESLHYVAKNIQPKSKQFHEFAFGKLHGIEKSDRMTRIAMTDMRLRGDGHSNIRCTDSLLDFANYPDIAPESFDLVLTNPPFGSLLGKEALATLGRFEVAQGRKNIPLEILGLERSIQFLRPGGRIGIVLPDNLFSIDSHEYVRTWLRQKVCIRAIISLPVETFSPFGANVKTGILFARKWRAGETPIDAYKVCLVKIESIGYDAAGRTKKHSDIQEAISTIRTFLSKYGW
jgi:type I restriction enzyme M protein